LGAVVGLELSSVLFVAVTEGDPLGYVAGKASYCLFPVEGIGSGAVLQVAASEVGHPVEFGVENDHC